MEAVKDINRSQKRYIWDDWAKQVAVDADTVPIDEPPPPEEEQGWAERAPLGAIFSRVQDRVSAGTLKRLRY